LVGSKPSAKQDIFSWRPTNLIGFTTMVDD